MKKFRYSLFFKYLLSYTIMFMVPVIAFTAFISGTLFVELEQQYTRNSTQTLSQFMQINESNLKQLDSICSHMLMNKNLNVTYEIDDVTSAKRNIDELQKYVTSNGQILEAVLFFEGDSFVYTSGSTYPVDYFFREVFVSENGTTFDDLIKLSRQVGKAVLPYQNMRVHGVAKRLMPVMFPLKLRGKEAVVLFYVTDAYTEVKGKDEAQQYIVFDETGRALREDAMPITLTSEDYSKIDVAIQSGKPAKLKTDDGQKHLVSYGIVSPDTNWRYAYVTEESAIYGDYKTTQKKFMLALTLVLAICVFITSINMSTNYGNLRRLKKIANELFSNTDRQGKDEISDIEDSLKGLAKKNAALGKFAASSGRANFLQQLLKGRVSSPQEFSNNIALLHLNMLACQKYYVLMICLRDKAKTPDIAIIEKALTGILCGYCKEHAESGMYIFVGSADMLTATELKHKLLDAHDALKAAAICDVTIACGTIQDGYANIPVSYIEAALAIDYRFIKGNNCVIDYSELALGESIGMAYPSKLFNKLSYQIKLGNADKIEQALSDIVDYIKKSNLPLYYAKGLCNQLINNISMIISELNKDLDVKQSSLSYATILADFDTADELMNAIKNICYNICEFIRSEDSDKESNLLCDMKQYLDEHCMDDDFSTQNLANEFNMSQSAVSTAFKSLNGSTIIDYITEKKMSKAKMLLQNTNTPIYDIAKELGYISTSSFIRRFKELYGITPGQFAELERKNNNEEDNDE